MLGACRNWQEFLCLSVLAYLGPRRGSASRLRWRDVDLAEGTIRFREKGGKVSVKPMPNELLEILRAASSRTRSAARGRLCDPESSAGERATR